MLVRNQYKIVAEFRYCSSTKMAAVKSEVIKEYSPQRKTSQPTQSDFSNDVLGLKVK